MKTTSFKKALLAVLSFVLIAVMVLIMTGCGNNAETPETTSQNVEDTTETPEAQPSAQKITVGEGKTQFDFKVTDNKGNVTEFEVHTDKATVGEALMELGLIDGEEGDYGLYVKTVNGVTLDYDKDGMYWAFYENAKYGSKGVDLTNIAPGVVYEFKAEK